MKTLDHLLAVAAVVATVNLTQSVQAAEPLSAQHSSKPWLSKSIERTPDKLPLVPLEANANPRHTASRAWLVNPANPRQEIAGLRTVKTSPSFVSSKPWLIPSHPKDVLFEIAPLK